MDHWERTWTEPLRNHISIRPPWGLLAAIMEQQRKKQHQQQQRGKLQRVLRQQKARLYIIRRCVVMLLCWSDWSQAWYGTAPILLCFIFCSSSLSFFSHPFFTLPHRCVDGMIDECSLFSCLLRKARLLTSPCKGAQHCPMLNKLMYNFFRQNL